MITALIVLGLFVLLAAGVPIGFAMGVVGTIGLYALGGMDVVNGILSAAPIASVSTYELVSVPLFILMAEFIVVGKVAEKLYDSLVIWMGRTPGGLAIATALAGAGFGAISGSSTVSAATLASTSFPAMARHGYEHRLANGVVAISGTLGMLIPPSLALILYSLLADISVAKVLIAGIVPGVIVTLLIIATVLFLVWQDPQRAPVGKRYTMREKIASMRATGPMILLIFIVTGSIYDGIATPAEASAVGAFTAFCLAYWLGEITWSSALVAIAKAARTAAMIGTILIGAHIFGYAMTLTQTTQHFVEYISALPVDRYVIISLVVLLKLLLGFFLDQVAILTLTVPIMVPLIVKLGFDPIWFGIILVVTAEVGMVTPPIGMNAFIIARYTGQSPSAVFGGVVPHVIAHMLAIIGFVAFPKVIMWLPSTM